MAVSAKKTTKARKRTRRSHHALDMIAFAYCSNCGHAYRPHNVCNNCDHYKGKKVI
jgi:large subunit ribosomal protein L32